MLRKSTLRSLTKNSDSSSTLNARKSISHQQAKEQWEALGSKIVLQLDKLIGKITLENKLTSFGDIIYQTCLNIFGAKQHQAKREPKKSRRQREMETLRKQKKNLRKQMKSATEEEKNGLKELWRGLKARHSALSRAESARKKRSKKKRTRNASTKTHFSLQDNSCSNQDQVLFQYRKNSWRPTSTKHILTQIEKYLSVNLLIWCGQVLPEKNSIANHQA